MSFLIPFTPIDLAHSLSKREGEKKIGEEINLITSTLSKTDGKFVLIGIPEDIGPRANVGNTELKTLGILFCLNSLICNPIDLFQLMK